ncbi:hypothetical protein OV208_03900 [Corallococcus sp. bb12-1]|uniref:hypothetical protein n=1 Tax=Corallococcus sp. bb12-1 TaxID=2996784 RepID=UPI00226D9819|nr:hypothetical protein [Corallococcus sp. bb12-1]MCY1040455.1 hypothetical protein [Corallococcus sp. bb12-1]
MDAALPRTRASASIERARIVVPQGTGRRIDGDEASVFDPDALDPGSRPDAPNLH